MMKMLITGIVLSLLIAAALISYNKLQRFENTKEIGGIKVAIAVDRYPLRPGDNTVTFRVSDRDNRIVNDASISIRYYYMPANPSTYYLKAATFYAVDAVLQGNEYNANINLPINGDRWITEITLKRGFEKTLICEFILRSE